MRTAILMALSCFSIAATPAVAQSYRSVEIVSPNALEFFIIRWDVFRSLARTDRDRYAKVATAPDFGPHPTGSGIRLRQLSRYAVMPVCREVMLAHRTIINANRNRETIQCP